MLDETWSVISDIVQGDGFPFDRKQKALDATVAAVEPLARGNAELFRFILGDGVSLGHRGQLSYGFLKAGISAGGSFG
jgi:hypothetical protein